MNRGTSCERHPWFARPGTPSPEEQAQIDAAAVPYPVAPSLLPHIEPGRCEECDGPLNIDDLVDGRITHAACLA